MEKFEKYSIRFFAMLLIMWLTLWMACITVNNVCFIVLFTGVFFAVVIFVTWVLFEIEFI